MRGVRRRLQGLLDRLHAAEAAADRTGFGAAPDTECAVDVVLQADLEIDAAGGFYTIDRMRDLVRKLGGGPIETLGQTIVDDVRRFLGKAPQNDDMCLVCVARSR